MITDTATRLIPEASWRIFNLYRGVPFRLLSISLPFIVADLCTPDNIRLSIDTREFELYRAEPGYIHALRQVRIFPPSRSANPAESSPNLQAILQGLKHSDMEPQEEAETETEDEEDE